MQLIVDNTATLAAGKVPGYDVEELYLTEEVSDDDYGAVYDIDDWSALDDPSEDHIRGEVFDDILSMYRNEY